jgi:hypothetical protein
MSSLKSTILINPGSFNDFLEKIKDLTKISDTIKLKIDSDNILMYSMMGSENMILAFKSYKLDTDAYFKFKSEIDYTLNIIITSAKKFVKSLQFIKTTEKITIDVTHRKEDENNSDCRLAIIKNGKFKLQIQAGENTEIRDIDKHKLSKLLNLNNKKWSFNVSKSDFSDIKQLSSINSEDNRRILHLNIEDFKVKLSETSLWELEVDETTESNKHLMFNKSYLSCINDSSPFINFHVFETFILINDDVSQLMISFEQDFSDE